jgi:hypothetical protein
MAKTLVIAHSTNPKVWQSIQIFGFVDGWSIWVFDFNVKAPSGFTDVIIEI